MNDFRKNLGAGGEGRMPEAVGVQVHCAMKI